jgi:hypothetical protein
VGLAYDPMTTKKNTLIWKICKTKEKDLQARSISLRKKGEKKSLTLHNLWEKITISTPPPL